MAVARIAQTIVRIKSRKIEQAKGLDERMLVRLHRVTGIRGRGHDRSRCS